MTTYYEGPEERLGIWLLCLPHIWAWYTGYVYTGHTMKKQATGWLLVLRFKDGNKGKVVFAEGYTPSECVKNLALGVKHKTLAFREDRFSDT
jgi:hypothetical protein